MPSKKSLAMKLIHFSILEKHQQSITMAIFNNLLKQIKEYRSIPRVALKSSISHFLGCFFDFLITSDQSKLDTWFKYIVSLRLSQSFPLSSILGAIIRSLPPIRSALQQELAPHHNEQNYNKYEQALAQLEQGMISAIELCTKNYQEATKEKPASYENTNDKKTTLFDLDFSKNMILKA